MSVVSNRTQMLASIKGLYLTMKLAPITRLKILLSSLLAVSLAGITAHSAVQAGKRVLRAGACAIDITPQIFPVSSNGGMSDRKAQKAHDPLHARCLVLDNGVTKIAIVVNDSCMIPRDIFDRAKEKASQATGIPEKSMLMSATHTHTAVTVTGVFQSEPEEEYRRFLVDRIARAVAEADSRLEPARVGWAVGNNPHQVFNRRWFMRSGFEYIDPFDAGTDKVRMNPPSGSSRLLKPAGPTDSEVPVLAVQAADGRPLALLANYSLHYVGGVPENMLSADYFGEFARQITRLLGAEDAEPAFVGIMSNGTSGDINNVNFFEAGVRRDPLEQIRLVASDVAESAYQAYKRIEYQDWVPLAAHEAEIELGVRLPSKEDIQRAKKILDAAGAGPYRKRRQIYARETVLLAKYPKKVPVRLQAIRIGGLGIVSSPCETFVETGLAIKQQSPLQPTFVIELANGYNGYLPTSRQHQLGGYETWRARSSYLAVDAEAKVRTTLLQLLGRAVIGDE